LTKGEKFGRTVVKSPPIGGGKIRNTLGEKTRNVVKRLKPPKKG